MKRKIIILAAIILTALGGMAQQRQIHTDTIIVRNGGTFGGIIKLDTNQVKGVDTATDNHDAVPFFQMMDSIQTAGGVWTKTTGGTFVYPAEPTDSVIIGSGVLPPLQDLTVYGTSYFDSIIFANGNIQFKEGQKRTIDIEQTTAGSGDTLFIKSGDAASASQTGGPLILTSGTGGSGSGTPTGGSIYIFGATGDVRGNLILQHDGTTDLGNVGIKNNNPLYTLDVSGIIAVDTNQIKEVDTATDQYDAMPMWQIIDSINAGGGGGSGGEFIRSTTFTDRIYPTNYTTDSVVIGDTLAIGVLTVYNGNIVQAWDGGNSAIQIGYGAGNMTALNNSNSVLIGDSAGKWFTTIDNVAIGVQALKGTEGLTSPINNYNVAIGTDALIRSTTGGDNVAIGYQAGFYQTTGRDNTLIGKTSLYFNETGLQNTMVGSECGIAGGIDPDYNVFMGYQAGYNIEGDYNTGIGTATMYRLETGNRNTTLGYRAGYTLITGSNNTYVGNEVGFKGNGVQRNVGIGYQALYDNFGDDNIALGFAAMPNNVNGDGSIYIGRQSGTGATNCLQSYNVAIGYKVGYSNDTTTYNVLIGYQAGYDLQDGDNNIAIGKDVEVGTTTSDSLNIGNIIQGDLANGEVYINDVLILTPRAAAPTAAQEGMIYSNSTDKHLYFYDGTTWKQLD